MEKYKLLKEIGSGTFGSVLKATNVKTGEAVAVKQMKQKFYSWDECVRLPEVQALRKFSSHPNIVKLKEVVRENNTLYFIFEFLDGDLLGRLREHKSVHGGLPHHLVKSYTMQLLQSLQFLHRCGYFHRDLKPENLLLKRTPGDPSGARDIIKLADFGLVKEIRGRPPFTDYVSTRWYRAPEVLLQDRAYSSPVDMWAVGCMMAELYTSRPLFPGSNEVDQMFKIVSVIGTPTQATWPEGLAMARKINYRFPNCVATPLEQILPKGIPADAIDLMKQLMVLDPRKRLTATQALNHPFFNAGIEEDSRIRPNMHQQLSSGLPAPMSAQNFAGGSPPPTMPPQQQQHGSSGSAQLPGVGARAAPSAPSPHFSKQVQWREERVIEELNKHGSAAKPSSSDRPRFPPVKISPVNVNQQQQNAATGGVPKASFATNANSTGLSANANTTTYSGSGSGTGLKQFDFSKWHVVKESPPKVPSVAHQSPPPPGSYAGSTRRTSNPQLSPLTSGPGSGGGGGGAGGTGVVAGGRPPLQPQPTPSSATNSYQPTAGGARKSPSPTKDIVDQALEELLMGSSPGGGKSALFGSNLGGSGRGSSGSRVDTDSPLTQLLMSSQYRSSGSAATSSGGNSPVDRNAPPSGGSFTSVRDRTNVPVRGGPASGSSSRTSKPLVPLSPSLSSVLERRRNQQQAHQYSSGSDPTNVQLRY